MSSTKWNNFVALIINHLNYRENTENLFLFLCCSSCAVIEFNLVNVTKLSSPLVIILVFLVVIVEVVVCVRDFQQFSLLLRLIESDGALH